MCLHIFYMRLQILSISICIFCYNEQKKGVFFVYFYERLRDLRLDHDFTQRYIALLLHTPQSQYALYECGRRELPMHHFITLARLYNVSLDYLAGLVDTPRTLDGSPYRVSKSYKIGAINQNGNGGTINNNFN